MESVSSPTERSSAAININRVIYRVARYWFMGFLFVTLVWVILPWLAPVFMRLGWEAPAQAIYWLYSFQCHQLPQRSFFLFGPSTMYSLDQLPLDQPDLVNPLALRQFIGNAAMGYKVAWSDRMVSAYTSIPIAAMIWFLFRKRLRPISIWIFVLLAIPMAIDGGTHMISDLAGVGQGFRTTNTWLAELTNHSLPTTFYAGNALGSFNSWMRLITGTLFGFGLMFLVLPYMGDAFQDMARSIGEKFSRADVDL
ncbi:MAG: DUF2085 domain-containing protein [Anaerolineales bacterium]